MFRLLRATCLISAIAASQPAAAQTATPTAPAATAIQRPTRPTPPTRDPNTPGYVKAKELPDGAVPSPKEDGNFIIGPTHAPAPEMTVQEACRRAPSLNSR